MCAKAMPHRVSSADDQAEQGYQGKAILPDRGSSATPHRPGPPLSQVLAFHPVLKALPTQAALGLLLGP